MQKQKTSLSYNELEAGILELSLEDQLKLTEILLANLKTALNRQSDKEKENQNDDLSRFCGKWQDDRDAEEIVSEIYNDRKKNIRSEKAAL